MNSLQRFRVQVAALAALLLAAAAPPALAQEALFTSFTLPVRGIARNYLAADFNGDSLRDIVVTHIVIDEAQRRVDRYFSLFLQDAQGFPNQPTQTWEAPSDAVGVDAADFDLSTAGPELGYLSGAGVFYYKFDVDRFIPAPVRLLTVSSLFRSADPYGVIRMNFAQDLNGDGQDEILVADFDQTYLYTASRQGPQPHWDLSRIFPTPLRARVSTPWENDVILARIEQNSSFIETSLPQVLVGDLDGDGRRDAFIPQGDKIFIYRQLSGGLFSDAPTIVDFGVFPLARFMRHGSIPEVTRLKFGDFNGDGLSDVAISRLRVEDLSEPSIKSTFYVYLNEDGTFPERPNEEINFDGIVEEPLIADFNGDGRDDIAVQRLPFGFWQVVRIKVFESVDLLYEVYYSNASGAHARKPDVTRSANFAFDLKRQSLSLLAGFSLYSDFDGDGCLDLLQSADEDSYAVLLSRDGQWASEKTTIRAPSSFLTFTEDLNGDLKDDVVVRYAGQGELDSTLRVLLTPKEKK